MRKNKTIRPQSEEAFGFLGVEAAGFRLVRFGALWRADFPDSAKPGGSGGFIPSTNSTRSHVPFLRTTVIHFIHSFMIIIVKNKWRI